MSVVNVHHRMKISTGMGFLRKPELVVLSPLSLLQSLIDELQLSRRSCPEDRLKDALVGVLSGRPSFKLGREKDGLPELFALSFFVGEPEPRLNRSIHDEAKCGT